MSGIGKRRAGKGQGALIAVAVITLIAMVTMAFALNTAAFYNARRMVSTRESLQLYYVAQAGIQEALSTRFVPRTNYLNFVQDRAGINSPFYGLSGKIYQDPATPTDATMLGVYRYFILGGDPASDPVSGLHVNNRYTLNDIVQPMYVLSKGTVCTNANGEIGMGAIILNGTDPRPTCQAGFQPEELTVLAKIDLSRTVTPNNDIVEFYRIFKNDTNIGLDRPVFVPGMPGPVRTNVDFETAWDATGANGEPLAEQDVRPVTIAFYNVSDTVPDVVQNIAGVNTVIATPIDASSVIKIYFNGGVDYRTLYIDPSLGQTINADCLGATADRENCTIRVRDVASGNLFTNSTIYPNLPAETQLQLFPPLGSGTVLTGGILYRIEIDTALSDWRGNRLPAQYEITFTTAP